MRPTFLRNLEMNGRERHRRFRIALPILYVLLVPGLQILATIFGAGHGHSDFANWLGPIIQWPWSAIGGGAGEFLMTILQLFLIGFALDYLVSLIPR